jgi:hypothetical protein
MALRQALVIINCLVLIRRRVDVIFDLLLGVLFADHLLFGIKTVESHKIFSVSTCLNLGFETGFFKELPLGFVEDSCHVALWQEAAGVGVKEQADTLGS